LVFKIHACDWFIAPLGWWLGQIITSTIGFGHAIGQLALEIELIGKVKTG
jgi:hypothetical protein